MMLTSNTSYMYLNRTTAAHNTQCTYSDGTKYWTVGKSGLVHNITYSPYTNLISRFDDKLHAWVVECTL